MVNIGKGSAMNYSVDTVISNYSIASPFFQYSNMLPPIFDNENAKVVLIKVCRGEEENIGNFCIKNSSYNNFGNKESSKTKNQILNTEKIIINYQDIYGRFYKSEILITPVGPRLSKYEIC